MDKLFFNRGGALLPLSRPTAATINESSWCGKRCVKLSGYIL
jgi:hypothetical protein